MYFFWNPRASDEEVNKGKYFILSNQSISSADNCGGVILESIYKIDFIFVSIDNLEQKKLIEKLHLYQVFRANL